MDKSLPFITHLAALRKTLLSCIVALLGATAICMPLGPRMLEILKAPAAGVIGELFYFSPEEALLVYMRIGFFCGLVVAFPVIIYSFWNFIAPAFGSRFRVRTGLFVAASFVAFLTGCAFGYCVLLPSSLRFLMGIGSSGLHPLISAARYISFTTGLTLACGIIFLMPVFVFFLAHAGLVTAGFLRRHYLVALVAILIIAAVITPTTDIFNMLAVAVPMLALYEISIWIAFFFGHKDKTHTSPLTKDDIYGEVS
jgi:sec-independent protein translocase protein TatC